jgi:IclR family acetate operon transcriptional repressor
MQDGPPEVRKTTQTSLSIVEAINDLSGATLSELSDYTGLATSTVHTHLRTLERLEYVVESDGEYRLGLKFFHLGESSRMRDSRYRLARQTATELANVVSEEVNFSVEEYGRSVVLFNELGGTTHGEFQVGRYFGMHSSASGKAMLAEFDEARVWEFIDDRGLPEYTDNTITDPERLFTELSTIREQGYAVNRQEEVEGLRAVGMAVTEADGSVFGALDISGPSYRQPDDEEVAGQLQPFVEELETAIQE